MVTECDYAIVGGGPGGLYAAWRLRTAKPNASVLLFEATKECGGRVRTLAPKALGFVADIGAMRFLSTQVLINGLVNRFGLDRFDHESPIASYFLRGIHLLPDLRESSPMTRNVPGIAQVSYQAPGQATVEQQNRYHLDSEEAHLPIGGLLQFGIAQVMSKVKIYRDAFNQSDLRAVVQPEVLEANLQDLAKESNWKSLAFKSFSIADWKVIKQFGLYEGQKHLYNCGLWELLSDTLSPEAFALARDSLGYDTIFGACNAAEHIPWFLAEFQGVHYYAVRGGMSRLTDKLKAAVPDIRDSHTLSRVCSGANGLTLTFLLPNNTEVAIVTKHLVLAVSKRALSKIDFVNLPLRPELAGAARLVVAGNGESGVTSDEGQRFRTLSAALDCINAHPLRKAFAFWDSAWFWNGLSSEDRAKLVRSERCTVEGDADTVRKKKYTKSMAKQVNGLHLISTRVQTNLPVRQVFLYGPAATSPWRLPGETSMGGMMMVYFDSSESEYFALLAGRNRGDLLFAGTPGNSVAPEVVAQLRHDGQWKDVLPYTVNEEFTRAMRRSLRRVFRGALGKQEVPEPKAVLFQDWTEAPFFGGWHSWNVTYKPWEMRPLLRRPFTTEAVMICGEVISADQGWIEGALRTCEAGLTEILKLEPIELSGSAEYLVAAGFLQKDSGHEEWAVARAWRDYLEW